MIIATAGHVDHGKTLLVHCLTGVDTDTLATEKERGLTIDLGFAYANFGTARIGFVDVPGHIRFIGNMLAGVCSIDAALLVVAADDGPMPQTREHVAILDLLGISRGLVALTKTDLVPPVRINTVSSEIEHLLAGTGLAGAPIVPVSGVTGAGIPDLKQQLQDLAGQRHKRDTNGHFRLAIDRCFVVHGAGIVVTGSVASGRIVVGDEVVLLPQGNTVRVRAIHRQDEAADWSEAGDRCALNIAGAGLDRSTIRRGNWIAAQGQPETNRCDAFVHILPNQQAIKHFAPVHVHAGASHTTGRLALLEQETLAPGSTALVQLVLNEPLTLWSGDRVIVRDQAATNTLGGGRIVDPFAPQKRRRSSERLALLRARLAPTVAERLTNCLGLTAAGFDFAGFSLAENLTRTQQAALLQQTNCVLIAGQYAVNRIRIEYETTALHERLLAWHEANPEASGATLADIATGTDTPLPQPLLQYLLDLLVTKGKLVRQGTHWSLPGHKAKLSEVEAKLWQKIEPMLRAAPEKPPVIHDLARELAIMPQAVERVLARLARLGFVTKPLPNRYFLPEGVRLLEDAVRQLSERHGQFSVKDYRDFTGAGRNLCIEILEHFDRTGFTRRVGDLRTINQRDHQG